ncbi:hypothetical protein FK85_17675 [Halorubrum saccharovorum]|uniref:Uncharacterized protein n=1 Tax=Halorubrum saccharovorum TaxID=2248 RepID=A0A081ES69_9EURY|nr:hypothetical protein [Halorubrum saccharovorum]KDS90257.1 hypothetical protein FK85_17675 [Halorubrum saccharovorum]
MAESCPHLAYREAGEGRSFDEPRAFCTVTESFVQPMRADICNARYGLDPAADCEFYVESEAGSETEPASESSDESETVDR